MIQLLMLAAIRIIATLMNVIQQRTCGTRVIELSQNMLVISNISDYYDCR
jgi:hypothetical protein